MAVKGDEAEPLAKLRRSRPSGILDIQNSDAWLRLDRVHEEQVRRGAHESWIVTKHAHLLLGAMIFLQSLVLGMEVSLELEGMPRRWAIGFLLLDALFLAIFLAEFVLRCQALGKNYLMSLPGTVDLFLLLTGSFATSVMAVALAMPVSLELQVTAQVVRRLRILRIGRIFTIFPALALLVKGLTRTMLAVLDSAILICIFCYIGALICSESLGFELSMFSSLGHSFLIHLQLVLVEAWPDIAEVMIEKNQLWALYVVGFVLLSSCAVLNVVMGVVCDGVLELAAAKPCKLAKEQEKELAALRLEVTELFGDYDGLLPHKRYVAILKSPAAKLLLEKMRIALPCTRDLRSLLERDQNGLSLVELQHGLLRLRESQMDLMGLKIQCAAHRLCHEASAALWQCGAKMGMAMERHAQELKEGILQQVQSTESIFQDLLLESEWYLTEEEELQRLVHSMARLRHAVQSLEQLGTVPESHEATTCSTGTQTEKPCRLPALPEIPGMKS